MADNTIGSFLVLGQIVVLTVVFVVVGFKVFNHVYDTKEQELFGHMKAPLREVVIDEPRCLKD
ncbi:hypothetical protein ACHHYP_15804 [Achlya hypogyna]|uniref:Uncharacterized protein n=1 Tax=Achlya hypogyna TaxID=1202772 RepID=A0A1V9ZEY9_ACHHY|nr:hypothetical protein ACHHYP_15804 [Achlya hypogyna]